MIAPDLFITAGHVVPLSGSLNEIVFGANYNTSIERYSILGNQKYPGYAFGNTATIDLGVGWTTNFVNGFDTETTFLNSKPYLQSITVAEYGDYGDITTGPLASLGDKLAGRAEAFTSGGTIYDNANYFTADFNGGQVRGIL
jgi:hypothetical protein